MEQHRQAGRALGQKRVRAQEGKARRVMRDALAGKSAVQGIGQWERGMGKGRKNGATGGLGQVASGRQGANTDAAARRAQEGVGSGHVSKPISRGTIKSLKIGKQRPECTAGCE